MSHLNNSEQRSSLPSKALGDLLFRDVAAPTAAAGAAAPPRVVIGGDFNAEPHEMDALARGSCLGGLARVAVAAADVVDAANGGGGGGGVPAAAAPLGPPPSGGGRAMTGLSADFARAECIDYVLVSPGLRVRAATAEKAPRSPYGAAAEVGARGADEAAAAEAAGGGAPAAVVGASDHVWQLVHLEID